MMAKAQQTVDAIVSEMLPELNERCVFGTARAPLEPRAAAFVPTCGRRVITRASALLESVPRRIDAHINVGQLIKVAGAAKANGQSTVHTVPAISAPARPRSCAPLCHPATLLECSASASAPTVRRRPPAPAAGGDSCAAQLCLGSPRPHRQSPRLPFTGPRGHGVLRGRCSPLSP